MLEKYCGVCLGKKCWDMVHLALKNIFPKYSRFFFSEKKQTKTTNIDKNGEKKNCEKYKNIFVTFEKIGNHNKMLETYL
jgi:hypothetical protein